MESGGVGFVCANWLVSLFSNLGLPINLLMRVIKDGVLDHRSSNPSVTGTYRLKSALQ